MKARNKAWMRLMKLKNKAWMKIEESVGDKESVNGREQNNYDDDRDIFDESVDYEPCPHSPEHNTALEDKRLYNINNITKTLAARYQFCQAIHL